MIYIDIVCSWYYRSSYTY